MVGQIQRVRHVRTRDDPAVVQQGRGFQRVRRPLGKEGNALKAIRTLRRATPIDGWGVSAAVAMTICGGEIVYHDLPTREA